MKEKTNRIISVQKASKINRDENQARLALVLLRRISKLVRRCFVN